MVTNRLKRLIGIPPAEDTLDDAAEDGIERPESHRHWVFENKRKLALWYPNWHTLHTILSTRNMRAEAVCKHVGLTPRQINDWDSRNYIGCTREGRFGWRKFSALDMFALAVLKHLKTLNLPLSLFVDEQHGHFINLPNILWLAMPYLIDGRKTSFGKEFHLGKVLLPICESVDKHYPGMEDSSYLMIALQPIARDFFSNVKIPELQIQIDEDARYSFEIEGKGSLTLEKLKLEGWA